MGYETAYTLTWTPRSTWTSPKSLDETIADIWRTKNNAGEDIAYAITQTGEFANLAKWYDWQKDVAALSAQVPGVLFTLNGKGEENGDIWRAYFLDGKVQVANAQIVIADFDESKLVDPEK